MQIPANDNRQRSRGATWWRPLIVGVLLGPILVLLFYQYA